MAVFRYQLFFMNSDLYFSFIENLYYEPMT